MSPSGSGVAQFGALQGDLRAAIGNSDQSSVSSGVSADWLAGSDPRS